MDNVEILKPLSEIKAPNPVELNQRAQSALAMVKSMTVDSPEAYELASDELKAIKQRAKAIEEQRTAITNPINQALKGINDLFRGPKEFLTQAETIIKRKMLDFTDIQERIAKEARRKQEDAQRAERARLAAEAAQREEEARKKADELAAEAKAAEEAGDVGRAAEAAVQSQMVIEQAVQESIAIETTAAATTAPVVETTKAAGISKRSTYKARIINKAQFLAFAATRPELQEIVDVNESKLNSMARALKTAMNYPGVEVYEDKTIAARS